MKNTIPNYVAEFVVKAL